VMISKINNNLRVFSGLLFISGTKYSAKVKYFTIPCKFYTWM
jgi:hypothetical protein